jgi:hypothetical protein
MDWNWEYYILMAHFAEIDATNIVTQVIVVHNSELLEEDGTENPIKGAKFCQSLFVSPL